MVVEDELVTQSKLWLEFGVDVEDENILCTQ